MFWETSGAKEFTWERAKKALGVAGDVDEKMLQSVELWNAMYQNRAPWLSERVKSLGLPATIAGELARLVTIEMKSQITGGLRAKVLDEAYQEVVKQLRQWVEFGCASGGFIIKPYVSGQKIYFDFMQAGRFYPIESPDRREIVGYITFETLQKGENLYYLRLEMQRMTERGCEFVNKAYVGRRRGEMGREVPLSDVEEWADLEPRLWIEHVQKPFFAYFKTPFANTVEIGSGQGVSCYARAVELIEQADQQYSRMLWEFESGERALYVDADAFYRDPVTGRPQLPDKRLYRTLDLETASGELFSGWTPELREENILRGLNAILIKIEDSCGLARGSLSELQETARTATEMRMMRQRTYATVTDTQKLLQSTLEDLAVVMDGLCSIYNLAPAGSYQQSFDFDDSVVSDRDAEFAERQALLSDGILLPWEFRMWYFGESEAVAKKALAAAEQEDKADEIPSTLQETQPALTETAAVSAAEEAAAPTVDEATV